MFYFIIDQTTNKYLNFMLKYTYDRVNKFKNTDFKV